MKRKTIALFALVALLVPSAVFAQAESALKVLKKADIARKKGGGLAVSFAPARIYLDGKPGETVTTSITVTNTTTQSVNTYVTPVAIQLTDQGGLKYLSSTQSTQLGSDTLYRGIDPVPVFNLRAGAKRSVPINIRIPSILKGTNYVGLSVRSEPGAKLPELEPPKERPGEYVRMSRVGISPELVCLITLDVAGGSNYSFEIVKASVTSPSSTQQLNANVAVKNTGDAELPVVLYGVVMGEDGKRVTQLKPKGEYRVRVRQQEDLSLQPSAFNKPGKYKMILTLVSPKMEPKSTEVDFTIRK